MANQAKFWRRLAWISFFLAVAGCTVAIWLLHMSAAGKVGATAGEFLIVAAIAAIVHDEVK